ncbi:MAG TPA: 3D domain-containing protein, partial [Tepidisphaeraceae bacterium]|nr:3D domain-containing protein [Tepidisphaeraceae bacterium]
ASVGMMPQGNGSASMENNYSGFMLDQDRGGAIRSAGRADIYMGIGQTAEQLSGYQLSPGKLYYLALRPELVGQYTPKPGRTAQ